MSSANHTMASWDAPHHNPQSTSVQRPKRSLFLLLTFAILFCGWLFLSRETLSYENNETLLQLKGSVNKADRLPSWLRDRAIDKLPIYSPSDSETNDDDTDRFWATQFSRGNHTENAGTVIDVVLIGSIERIEQMNNQRDTWASYQHFVRNTFMATENNTDNGLISVIEHGSDSEKTRNGTCQNLIQSCATSFNRKSEELCFQRRIGLSIGRFVHRYRKIIHSLSIENKNSTNNSTTGWKTYSPQILPDYLVVTFDTISYNTSRFEECIAVHDRNIPIMFAPFFSWINGSTSNTEGGNRKLHNLPSFLYPTHNTGVVFNRKAVDIFTRPVPCYSDSGTKALVPIDYDPQMEELEYQLCLLTRDKGTNIYDSILYEAFRISMTTSHLDTHNQNHQRNNEISVSDLFSMFSSNMHLLCASHEKIPTGEEMLGYLIHHFGITLREIHTTAMTTVKGVKNGDKVIGIDTEKSPSCKVSVSDCDLVTMLACANFTSKR